MTDLEDVLLQLALKRYDEFNDDRKSIAANVGLLLAMSGVLFGLIANMWFENGPSYWIWMTLAVLLVSIAFCLYVCIAQKFKTIDTVKWWEAIGNDESITSPEMFKQKIIVTIDETEKYNTEKIERLWHYYNMSIATLMAALILLLIYLLSSIHS